MFNKKESRLVNKRHKSYKKGHSLRRKPIATITESIRLSIAISKVVRVTEDQAEDSR